MTIELGKDKARTINIYHINSPGTNATANAQAQAGNNSAPSGATANTPAQGGSNSALSSISPLGTGQSGAPQATDNTAPSPGSPRQKLASLLERLAQLLEQQPGNKPAGQCPKNNAAPPASSTPSGGSASPSGGASSGGGTPSSTPPSSSGGASGPSSSSGSGPKMGGNVDQWVDQAIQILKQSGVPEEKMNREDIKKLIQKESGGNPNAVNNWDSNAKKGVPSKGLMQTIQPTFDANKLPGHNDIMNPVDNIIAGVRYAIKRYGSVSNTPGVKSMNSGGGYKPY